MAEIPTFAERQGMDTDRDGRVSGAEEAVYEQATCRSVARALRLDVDGQPTALELRETGLSFPQGQGALTLRLVCVYAAPLAGPQDGTTVRFTDAWHGERTGWREIVVQGDGVGVAESSVPDVASTERLTRYPDDPLAQPLAVHSAEFVVAGTGPDLPAFDVPDADPVERPSGPPGAAPAPIPTSAAVVPSGIGEIGDQVAGIIQAEELTAPVVVTSLLVAAGLGALHALSPGHGKTVMAAYLVGPRGTARQALGLGLTVTVAHTVGVLALGVITLWAGAVVPPERLYPVLGLVSGLLVLGIGFYLVLGRVRAWQAEREEASSHTHGHGHEHPEDHAHGPGHTHAQPSGHDPDREHRHEDADGWHSHGLARHTHTPPAGSDLRWRGLFALGLSGGVVPSVSALILLLGSVSLGRPAYGIVLTVAFGAGMAAVLVGVGMAFVYARGLLERLPARTRSARLASLVPTATALVVLVAGGLITIQAALAIA
jgi:ABC-type nickel/cobalt efflux system permease component RcnA